MSWADNSYWVTVNEGLLNIAGDESSREAMQFLQEEGVKSVGVRDFDPCSTCPHIEPCMDSQWNGGRRMGGPPAGSLTGVHTCKTCGENVLSVFPSAMERRVIPDKCPRWNSSFGCALDCEGCQKEKGDLQRSHPYYNRRVEAVKESIVLAVQGKKAAFLEDVFSLCLPEEDSEGLSRAQKALGALMADITFRFPSVDFGDDSSKFIVTGMLLERIYLSQKNHPEDPTKVAHEFLLAVTDMQPFSRAWVEVSVPARRMAERTWAVLLSR